MRVTDEVLGISMRIIRHFLGAADFDAARVADEAMRRQYVGIVNPKYLEQYEQHSGYDLTPDGFVPKAR